jgi:hypothetical protein
MTTGLKITRGASILISLTLWSEKLGDIPSLLALLGPYHRAQLLPKFDSTNSHTRIGPKRGLGRGERCA